MKTEHLTTNTSDPIWASNVELLPSEECLPVIGSCQVSSILQNLDGTPHDPHNLQNMDLIILNGSEYKPLTENSTLNYIILKDTNSIQPTDFSKPHDVPEKSKTPEKTNNFEDMLYFVCNMCPFLSTKDNKITEHIETAHKDKSSDTRAQLSNFKCPACTNIFHHRSSLKFHLLYDHYVAGDELDLILQAVLYYSNIEKKKNENREADNSKVAKDLHGQIVVSDSSETDKEPELINLKRFTPRLKYELSLTPSKMMVDHDSSSNCSNSNSTEYFEIHSPGDRPPSVLESTPKKPKILQQSIVKYPVAPKQLILPSVVPSLEWEQTKTAEGQNKGGSMQGVPLNTQENTSGGTEQPSKNMFSQVHVNSNSLNLAPPRNNQPSKLILNGTLSLNNLLRPTTPVVPLSKKVVLPQMDITPKNGEQLFADNLKGMLQKKMADSIAKLVPGRKCIYENCKVRMNDVTKLNYHIGCHTDDGFKCMECLERFALWKPLTSHLWRFHKIDMELFSCDKCDYKTFSLSKLNNIHKLTHGEAKNFQCDICHKFFKNAKQVHNHKEIHKEKTGKPGLKCETCQKTYNDKRTLKIHMDSVHKKLKPFLCNFCGYKGPTRASLKMHIRLHTGEKPFACDECSYSTSDHNSLRRHKLRHSGQKPYKCSYCSYACIQSSTYKAHLKTKHPGLEKELMFTCSLCQYRTVNKEMFASHLVTVHHQEPPVKS